VTDVINRVRQMHEMIIHRAFSNRFLPIVRLHDQVIVGQDYLGWDDNLLGANSQDLRAVLDIDCPLTRDTYHMLRLAATEDFKEECRKGLLFLSLQAMELEYRDLMWQFCRLVDITEKPEFLVIGVPFRAAREMPQFEDVVHFIHSLKLRVAYTDFAGTAEELQQTGELKIDFVKLASSLIENIDESSARQDQIDSIVQTAAELNSVVLASNITTSTEAEVCKALGCFLGEGAFFKA
jgi:EAL domain-containing protein (putative c-di-GMP-specific phosphodiesterase class I)